MRHSYGKLFMAFYTKDISKEKLIAETSTPIKTNYRSCNEHKEEFMYDERLFETAKEQEQDYYFTFGGMHKHPGCFIKIHGTFNDTRNRMIEHFGIKWAFQYSTDGWISNGISQAEKWHLREIYIT